VFMDARHTVTVEEWGSLPPKTANFNIGETKYEKAKANRART
jgi:hypothetical protein